MAQKKQKSSRLKKLFKIDLPDQIKQWIWGVAMFLIAIIISLSFFNLAGRAGELLMKGISGVIGKAVFLLPLVFGIAGLSFFVEMKSFKKKWRLVILALVILIMGISGILGIFNRGVKLGGWLGYLVSWPFFRWFGFWVSLVVFSALMVVGSLILFYPLYQRKKKAPSKEKAKPKKEEKPSKPSLVKKIFTAPEFKVKPLSPEKKKVSKSEPQAKPSAPEKPTPLKEKEVPGYKLPPLNLLKKSQGGPDSGDIKSSSAIIKRTLQNFDIPVEMGGVNVGPTVTQYTLKPAEGVKLSKITALSDDLALALAAHPIRIEAPIPGRSLVGIEVPNKKRAQVRLRSLIDNPNFKNSPSSLTFCLGRDVSGSPTYADLAKMPHLLVAGSTGSGKTVFLNSLILSLLYRNSPQMLKLILIDPKRVEFPVYDNLAHLLTPVISKAEKTIGALDWLTDEMERRFDVLSESKKKNIDLYNEAQLKEGKEVMPFIVFIVDELADLMAAKGREIEGGIVRLAQMARAVGIHLVVATQRPSVEVVTGLIKANITSRVAFQVASQTDSRTVFDMAGAETLLGDGDMLFISSEISKPKRIQGAYISHKEVKKVTQFIKSEYTPKPPEETKGEKMEKELEEALKEEAEPGVDIFAKGKDPLFEKAKKIVVKYNKGSASLLQRRLRIGYARAARLIDMLEEKGVVGPPRGSKARKVLVEKEEEESLE